MAVEKIGRFASVEVINHPLEGSLLDSSFKIVEEHGNELLNVLLHHNIDLLAVRFVSLAKPEGHEIDSGSLLEMREYPLDLVQEIIINLSVNILIYVLHHIWSDLVIDPQEQVPESLVHVELLQKGNYVANVSEILQPSIPIG